MSPDYMDPLRENRSLPPFFDAFGMTIEEIDQDQVVVRVDVPDAFYTMYGAIHGGLLAAVMDTVGGMVVASHLTLADRTATHSFNLNYVSFVRERSCKCVGRLIAKAQNVATVEIEVLGNDGKLAVKAIGTFGIFRNKNRAEE